MQVLTRMRETQPGWRVLRVAIVEIRQSTYIGRIFFGEGEGDDAVTHWDCDVRPSDATWVALRAGAPLYVNKSVWAESSHPLRASTAYQAVQAAQQKMASGGGWPGAAAGGSFATRAGISK